MKQTVSAIKKIALFTFVSLALVTTACIHTGTKGMKTESDGPIATGNDTIISMWSGSVKDRGSRFDVNFFIKNMSTDQAILLPAADLTCRRGQAKGELKLIGKNKIENAIYLKAGQSRNLNLGCVLESRGSGDFTIEVGKILAATPTGAATKNVIATNLGWHYVDAESTN